jgi:hypothetical protein
MKECVKQSNAVWSIRLRVVDRRAKSENKKYLIYDYSGDIATENVTAQILNALIGAEHYSEKWRKQQSTQGKVGEG